MVKKGYIMVESIKSVLMSRDGMSEEDALEAVRLGREHLNQLIDEGRTPFDPEIEDFCLNEFGLEPDYLDELLGL